MTGYFATLWAYLRLRNLREIALLLLTSLMLLAFAKLASEVVEGDTATFDSAVLHALEDPHGQQQRIGPVWMEAAIRDMTSLGSVTVVGLVTAAVLGFLVATRRFRTALLVLVSVAGGSVLNVLLKSYFQRERPEILAHGVDVSTTSFPSGHAMLAATVYLTLGGLLATVQKEPLVRTYCVSIAVVLTLLVGLSRVYLGVHWPTDVLAGWCVGAAWAILCLVVAAQLERNGLKKGYQ
jgi:undecaprenyl-diphosphatase